MAYTLRFDDNSTIKALTLDGLLRKWNKQAWNKSLTPDDFRKELAYRAYLLTGKPCVHPKAATKTFMAECERAGLFKLER